MLELERIDDPQITGSGGLWNSIFGGDDGVSLRSRAFLSILFLMSEGEIAGFPAGQDIRKYIYVNDTAIVNQDGSENFRGVQATWRSGTQFQDAIAGLSQGAASPTSVGVIVKNSGSPVIRTINSPLAGKIKVSLFTDGLSRTDGEGFVKNSEARFKIYLSTNGSPFILKVDDSFSGRTAGGYTRDYTIDVTGSGPWQIKVERTNPDVAVNNTKEQNNLYWQSYTPIVEQLFRHPNSALLFVKFDSAYFKSTPTITVKLNGLICRIPSNYNPNTRTYSGFWDGTFTRSFTNNPAWCLLELLTNARFGTGNYIPLASVDKWSLYRICVYCDGLVNNGFGGQEPRFVYNNYLNTKVDAFSAVQSILGQIRGVAYYANGQILFSQDRPDIEPVDIYTLANTVCEYDEQGVLTQPNFTYDYVSLKEKHAKCHVNWYDPNEFGKKKTAYVDLFDIGYGQDFQRYGDEVKEVDLPGCTSEAEARRHGRWILLTERLESKTVSFATGEQGLLRLPGDLIKISDPYEAGARNAGKIASATLSTITVDDPVDIGAGINNLSCIINGQEQIRPIINAAGTHTVLTVSPGFSDIPEFDGIWMIGGASVPETYRILSISNPDLGKYGIVAIKHAGKYAAIDSLETLTPNPPNLTVPLAPLSITVRSIPSGYFVGWLASQSVGVTGYALEYESDGSGFWSPIPLSSGTTDAEVVLPQGAYRFRVRAQNIYGRSSAYTYSGLSYATVGTILSHNEDGSIALNSQVNLEIGVQYFLDTYCSEPAGYSSPSLPNPYQDRRKIITAAGITNTIEVSPSYLGDRRSLTTGSYSDLELYNPVTYLKLITGSATVYSGVNYTGTATVITPGTYYNAAGQAPPRSAVVTAGTLNISQFKPGINPVVGSSWQLTTTPLEALTANGFPITISAASTVAITI
jgi:predicted phage tail protein